MPLVLPYSMRVVDKLSFFFPCPESAKLAIPQVGGGGDVAAALRFGCGMHGQDREGFHIQDSPDETWDAVFSELLHDFRQAGHHTLRSQRCRKVGMMLLH